MRPTAVELYEALTELQSSAAAYVQGLETENRRLRTLLREAYEFMEDEFAGHELRARIGREIGE